MYKKILIALAVLIVFGIAGASAFAFITGPTKGPSDVRPDRPMGGRQTQAKQPAMPSMEAPSGTYQIVPELSKTTFTIHEELRGEPKTVVGTNNYIGGFFSVDRTDLTKAQLSAIRINARGFQTDSSQRDNTTRRAILKTEDDANEYIVFTPKSMEGVPTSTEIGATFPFRITGDLLISGTTKEVTFTGSGNFASDDEFDGSASSTVKRSDFNLIVPNFPFLANVSDDVTLNIDFVAKK